ncbi:acyltransferase [Actinoplanes sp. LDG1-06]|uniref:Acyltransferase n=1 Tax=Paractinoplanes ovalisporus TaxID=2810368 RepID=A0ABS2A6K1_9ACTN|nr:acyltransferase [Actinoplanes ovalisporus]MBM2615472.1 acyltransferase [Actinoplanes ovalisporus]
MTTLPPYARVAGLDEIRGLTALYVVVHHCWLLSFPGYPANTGPGWLGWLVHGRFAVVVFIVLSGFSLALAPARNGWRLGDPLGYARRRARRILPAYWAALAASALIATLVPALPLSEPQTARSLVVHGLLLQDFMAAPTPNGAFWSIAVEAALYVAFPVIVWARRRIGALATLAVVTGPVVAAGLLWPGLATGARATGYTFELAPLFTVGVLAAGVVSARDRIRRRPWLGMSAVAGLPVLALVAFRGPVWTAGHYYWLDLAAGPAIALLLAAVATRERFPGWGPLRALGGFSYSLYLIHMPIVALITTLIVAPYVASRPAAFGVTLVLVIPLVLVAAWLFAALFEAPFRSAPRRRDDRNMALFRIWAK